MKYLVFNTEQEAIKAELAISKSMNYPNQETKTERWAVPFQLADGRWVFQSPDDTGIPAEDDWWPKPELQKININ